jgi:hypothetical protein
MYIQADIDRLDLLADGSYLACCHSDPWKRSRPPPTIPRPPPKFVIVLNLLRFLARQCLAPLI